jgi:eukaryotic-like serine/threonine-protein kinase
MIDALPGDIFQRGQVLNHTYEIEGVLGRGGTGEVYRARNLISGRVVAIKALNQQFSGNDAYIDLMKREEQMRDILHDAVVRYTECSRSDQGHVFLVMDFIDGPSMNEVMLARRMEPRELMVIGHRVAEGLVAAHKRGIVHRDLSPDNVILRDANPERATIIDFGIAKDTAAGARTIVGNDFAGKYEYAAPEQLEGRAEPRSDLYALGALLLAGFRGQIPFAGATPGEMIRRKQGPLDTLGVPEPLKAFIEWLAAPRLADRAPSAEAVVTRLDALLKPQGRDRKDKGGDRQRRPLVPALMAVLLVAVLGAGAWMGGLFDRLFPEPIPVASPYAFAARSASPTGPAAVTGNAPDAETAERLVAAFDAAAGASAPPEALTIASGQPGETWPQAVTALFDGVRGMEEWSVALADRSARIEGIAPDRAARERIAAALDGWAAQHGFTLSAALMTGPRSLPAERVVAALAEVADCGALAPDRPAGESYGLGDTIRVRGDVAQPATATLIEAAVAAVAGDRQVSLETETLNADLCAVRRVLPDVPSAALSIWMGDGETGQANPAGIYRTGQNPVVEIHAPANLTDGSLWVAVVDNTGKVFNILPNINDEEHDLADIGTVENGVRRIRVLHSLADQQADTRRLAVRVNDGDYGKSEIVAILSRTDLFQVRRPRDESVASFAEALAEIQKKQPGNIVGLASRLLDSRP